MTTAGTEVSGSDVEAGTLVADVLLLLLLVDSTESEDELQADARISINAVRVATIK